MKKIRRVIAIILCVSCIGFAFTGCVIKDTDGKTVYSIKKESTMVYDNTYYAIVGHYAINDSCEYYIVYDKETKVMYHMSDSIYHRGSLIMLVNADGSPKIYEGE